MQPRFDIGTPRTAADLNAGLGTLLASGTASLMTLTETAFFAPQGSAWSPAEHVRHLRKTTAPVARALLLPRWLLALRFGRRRGSSAPVELVRERYDRALAAGATAGRFAPSPEPLPLDLARRRTEILQAWAAATVELQRAVARWPEAALDGYQLPHPLLGPLSIREMLVFTLIHTAHHLRRVVERSAA